MKNIFFILIFFGGSFVYGQENWTLEKTKSGVKAYSRIKDGADYYEFRTIFRVEANLIEAKNLVTDVTNFKNWLPNTIDSKLLKKINDSLYYGYTVTETPWPLSDRDLVFKATVKKVGSKLYSILLEGTPDYFAKDKSKVRVQEYKAQWIIKEIQPNVVTVYYQASFNPGSTYPSWMIKNSMIDARIQTSLNFRAQLVKNR